MAPFRLPVERATLAITDGPYAGVEVTVDRSVGPTVREQLLGLATGAATTGEERDLFALLETRVILSWNVADHKGKRIPTTARGFAFCPPALIARIIHDFLAMVE